MRPLIAGLLAAALAAVAPAPATAQDTAASGSFAELAGEAGCMVQAGILTDNVYDGDEEGLKNCAKARGLMSSVATAVSPDGKNVYVASTGSRRSGSNAIVTFARALDTGALSFTECVSDDGGDGRIGSDGLCGNGDALLGASDVVISPDGRFVYVPAAGSNGISWFARDPASGRLTQAGCVKEVPREDHCLQGVALIGASDGAISADGLFLYVTSSISDAVAIFARDPETGALTQAGCISHTGSDGRCADGTALTGASSVVISADGTSAYVTAAEIGAVTSYTRDPVTGLLTPKGCLVEIATEGGPCTANKALGGASDAALTPDGKQLVVAARTYSTLVVFNRDAAAGTLAQAGCFQNREPTGDDVIPDPDEEEFEEELEEDEEDFEEEEFEEEEVDEEEGSGLLPGCEPAKAVAYPQAVTTSTDGNAVFVVGGDSLAAFQRDPLTGNLRQFACAENYRSYRSCTDTRGLGSAVAVAASPDGRNLYVPDVGTGSVTTFGAAPAVTAARARLARDGRAAVRVACPRARTTICSGRIAVAVKRDHARGNVFRVAPGRAARVRVSVPRRVQRTVRRRRAARVTLVVRDARRATRLSGRRITIRR